MGAVYITSYGRRSYEPNGIPVGGSDEGWAYEIGPLFRQAFSTYEGALKHLTEQGYRRPEKELYTSYDETLVKKDSYGDIAFGFIERLKIRKG